MPPRLSLFCREEEILRQQEDRNMEMSADMRAMSAKAICLWRYGAARDMI